MRETVYTAIRVFNSKTSNVLLCINYCSTHCILNLEMLRITEQQKGPGDLINQIIHNDYYNAQLYYLVTATMQHRHTFTFSI